MKQIIIHNDGSQPKIEPKAKKKESAQEKQKSKLIPVEGRGDLCRDPDSLAIINVDRAAYNQYMSLKEQRESEKNELQQLRKDIDEIKSLLMGSQMDPDSIELKNLTKSFEYHKIQSEIDSCDDRDVLRNIAKAYAKLYLKQQEVVSGLGFQGI